MDFGYYPYHLSIKDECFEIGTFDGLSEIVSNVSKYTLSNDGWFFAPTNTRIFSLPKTHYLSIHPMGSFKTSTTQYEFLTWWIGFLLGTRLSVYEAGFLDAACLKEGRLVDFVLALNQRVDAIRYGLEFSRFDEQQGTQQAYLVSAAIHALFQSQTPNYLDFEIFNYRYAAIDALFRVHLVKDKSLKSVPHFKRISCLCDNLGMPTPIWAQEEGKSESQLSVIRNSLIHEASLFGKPLGYQCIENRERRFLQEMSAFICRLLVATVISNELDYVKTEVDTYQYHGLELQ